jgi:hypothetical protein
MTGLPEQRAYHRRVSQPNVSARTTGEVASPYRYRFFTSERERVPALGVLPVFGDFSR